MIKILFDYKVFFSHDEIHRVIYFFWMKCARITTHFSDPKFVTVHAQSFVKIRCLNRSHISVESMRDLTSNFN